MKPHALLLALAALMTPAAAHADWAFGEHFWMELTSGLGGYTGFERGSVSLNAGGTLGFRTDEHFGVELGLGYALDPLEGAASFGVSVLGVWLPGTDAVRLRAGPRMRIFSFDPAVGDRNSDCFDCKPGLAAETTDIGLELGVLSQWNLGPFFFSVEWVGLYQPLYALSASWVHHDPGHTHTSKADWRGVELPAELRFMAVGAGLTF